MYGKIREMRKRQKRFIPGKFAKLRIKRDKDRMIEFITFILIHSCQL